MYETTVEINRLTIYENSQFKDSFEYHGAGYGNPKNHSNHRQAQIRGAQPNQKKKESKMGRIFRKYPELAPNLKSLPPSASLLDRPQVFELQSATRPRKGTTQEQYSGFFRERERETEIAKNSGGRQRIWRQRRILAAAARFFVFFWV